MLNVVLIITLLMVTFASLALTDNTLVLVFHIVLSAPLELNGIGRRNIALKLLILPFLLAMIKNANFYPSHYE